MNTNHYPNRFFATLLFCCTVAGLPACDGRADARVAAGPDERPATESELVELNRTLWEDYILRHDTRPYETGALPEFLFIANIGLVETRDEVIATVGNLDFESASAINEAVLLHGDTAVLIGRLESHGRVLGNRVAPLMRYMSVFVRTDDGWKVLAQSLTDVVDPADLVVARDAGAG